MKVRGWLKASGWLLAVVVVYSTLGWAFIQWTNLPVVYYSNSMQECVVIRVKNRVMPCDKIPQRYHVVWVR